MAGYKIPSPRWDGMQFNDEDMLKRIYTTRGWTDKESPISVFTNQEFQLFFKAVYENLLASERL